MSIRSEHYRLFDFFFLIHRKPVAYQNLLLSLEKRLKEVIKDMEDYPLSSSIGGPVTTLKQVLECAKLTKPFMGSTIKKNDFKRQISFGK